MNNVKKSIIGPVISVFVMVLIVSILAGLTFLFVAQLKNEVVTTSSDDVLTINGESGGFLNATGYRLARANDPGFRSPTITFARNATTMIGLGNISVSSTGVVTNATGATIPGTWQAVVFNYTYIGIGDTGAYDAVNDTEAAGSTVVNYLALIFLAVIFGAILTLVLRIILPYINLGQSMGGF